MTDFAWLTSRPIAHRGLHASARGVFENTLSAAEAAIARGYAIECDVQRSADGEAIVFHDFTLDRLTPGHGAVSALPAATLATLSIGTSADAIVTLPRFLAAVGGRTPLICEVKTAFDGDFRLADRVASLAQSYPGPLAIKSFDPAVLAHLRRKSSEATFGAVPLGIVAEAEYDDPEWAALPITARRDLAALSGFDETRPDFLSYHVRDLPHAAATLFRAALNRPVMTWTVRSIAQRETAARWADQMVFEGFEP